MSHLKTGYVLIVNKKSKLKLTKPRHLTILAINSAAQRNFLIPYKLGSNMEFILPVAYVKLNQIRASFDKIIDVFVQKRIPVSGNVQFSQFLRKELTDL